MDNKFSHQAPSHSTDGYMPSVSTPSTYDTTNDQQSPANEMRPEHIAAQPTINNPNTALNSNFNNQSIATKDVGGFTVEEQASDTEKSNEKESICAQKLILDYFASYYCPPPYEQFANIDPNDDNERRRFFERTGITYESASAFNRENPRAFENILQNIYNNRREHMSEVIQSDNSPACRILNKYAIKYYRLLQRPELEKINFRLPNSSTTEYLFATVLNNLRREEIRSEDMNYANERLLADIAEIVSNMSYCVD